VVTKKKPVKQLTARQKLAAGVKGLKKSVRNKTDNYLARRPHRSFRRTRRRDYVRSLQLPGYFAFTSYVRKTLWVNRKTFIFMGLIYAVITAIMVGVASQDTYTTLTDTIKQTSGNLFAGNWGAIGQASLLLVTAVTGGITNTLTDAQQIYAALIILLTWLTTVWLLRSILAGHKARLRDGLYNASAPLLSTFLVALVLIAQLLPIAIALIGYSAASSTQLLDSGVAAMLFWIVAALLAVLSLYFITSTFIALVVVTLPGMYPMQALKTAGDLVIGRRIRILLRMVWLGLSITVMWFVIMIPVILFDTWLKSLFPTIQWLPLIPVALLVMSTITVIWSASYVYLLYRRVVEDDAAPA